MVIRFYHTQKPKFFYSFFNTTMAITITVQNQQWEVVSSFTGNADEVLSTQINNNNGDIAVACGSWACMVCACTILKGDEYLDKQKFWQDLAGIEENKVLTCIAGLKQQYCDDDKTHEVILQKTM